MPIFEKRSTLPVPVEELFAYHARPGAIQRLIPPWQAVKMLENSGHIRDGARMVIQMKLGPFKKNWVALHHDYVEGRQFCDRQVSGPFAKWDHTHQFEAGDAPGTSTLTDHIEYELPMGPIGRAVGGGMARRQLEGMFAFRHRRTRFDLERHAAYRAMPRLRVAITGATGLLGTALSALLTTGGHTVLPVSRTKLAANSSTIHWNTETGEIDAQAMAGCDALIHLAGRNIGVRWTKKHRQEIWDSRIPATEKLCRTIAALPVRPATLICASGVGIYGNRGDEELTEESTVGDDYPARICKAWEAATAPAANAGLRVANIRIGVVLAAQGGALKKLLPSTRWGLAGPIGGGRQFLPWISMDDALGVIYDTLMINTRGPINAVSPQPIRQRDFIQTLAHLLHRPAIIPMPTPIIRLLFGEMGTTLLLGSIRAQPTRLLQKQFHYVLPTE